ncbi:SHD1 domain-containing protein [Neorhodopirellula pilleata]|uniref:SLA1 homology domain-containing protein n=1 Tax=Neorhodopirellula pilleata TaxID=2714738 RepID=A0A5C5ZL07_9BACT|nr:SHD1 domain-containing protein [Neorhodopirellula pilleata]TWT87855.1 hypothetical protein Pla100_58940 [Neorhodopirellula pilleata]
MNRLFQFFGAGCLFVLLTAPSFATDVVTPIESDPFFQLSNLRRGEDNSLLFNFKRTKKAIGFKTVFMQGRSKGRMISITATVNPYAEEDIVTLRSFLPANSSSPIDLELYFVTMHTIGEKKYLYSMVSNAVQIGNPGTTTTPRPWTDAETQGYNQYLNAKPTTVKRYNVDIDVPPEFVTVPLTAELTKGTPLKACYSSKWSPITTLAENADGSVFVRWDEWGESYDCNMLREELVIAKADLTRLAEHPEGKFPDVHPSLVTGGESGSVDGSGSSTSMEAKPLKDYPVSITVPADSQFIPDSATLPAQTKLQACYAGKWNPITFLSHYPDGTLTVRWDDYGAAYDCRMKRSELIIKKSLLATTGSEAPQESASRIWTDSTGRFKVSARLIEQSSDSVTLLTDAGKTVKLPRERLSQTDQDFLSSQERSDENPFE